MTDANDPSSSASAKLEGEGDDASFHSDATGHPPGNWKGEGNAETGAVLVTVLAAASDEVEEDAAVVVIPCNPCKTLTKPELRCKCEGGTCRRACWTRSADVASLKGHDPDAKAGHTACKLEAAVTPPPTWPVLVVVAAAELEPAPPAADSATDEEDSESLVVAGCCCSANNNAPAYGHKEEEDVAADDDESPRPPLLVVVFVVVAVKVAILLLGGKSWNEVRERK